ncbi:MAG: hypothetical protein IJW49_02575 [Clostridia bacterium]|nr:hypothetical protein [Clostridia bacterium]
MIDCGLGKDEAGVKFNQSLLLKDEYKFNNLAARGTELYHYLKEHRAPFYIDRLQGGCYIEEYHMTLVEEYRPMPWICSTQAQKKCCYQLIQISGRPYRGLRICRQPQKLRKDCRS